jgi:hypothetical protein
VNGAPHIWKRERLTGEVFVVRCTLCKYRRDALEARGFDPDGEGCPLRDPSLCGALVNGDPQFGVCRLPTGHDGDHRGAFGNTWMNAVGTALGAP